MNKTPRIVAVESKKVIMVLKKCKKTHHASKNEHILSLKMAKFRIFMLKIAKMGARS